MDHLSPHGESAEVVEQLRGWLSGPDAPLVVETSGSTGEPKRVQLSRAAVLASVAASAQRLGATGPWVLVLPPTYVAGVQVILRSLVAGHEPALLDRDGWPGGDGWFVSLVPTQLGRMLADDEAAAALRRAHTVLLGGGPIDPALRARAEAAGVRVVATYGAAETAGGCVYDGVPLDGVAVALGESGRIRIAGPTLFSGYVDDPLLTDKALQDGWFLTSDAGRFDEDGRLQVLGRVDDVVVSGGVNVPAPAVAARLRAHPEVAAAEVLGVPDEEWGHRVVAFVVFRGAPPSMSPASEPPSSQATPHARSSRAGGQSHPRSSGGSEAGDIDAVPTLLRDWVGEVHPRAWAPRQVVVLDAIPELPNGKPDRRALRDVATSAARGEAP